MDKKQDMVAAMVEHANLPQSRRKAKEVGSSYYFTRKACANGHYSPRYTSNGKCAVCQKIWVMESQRKARQNEMREELLIRLGSSNTQEEQIRILITYLINEGGKPVMPGVVEFPPSIFNDENHRIVQNICQQIERKKLWLDREKNIAVAPSLVDSYLKKKPKDGKKFLKELEKLSNNNMLARAVMLFIENESSSSYGRSDKTQMKTETAEV